MNDASRDRDGMTEAERYEAWLAEQVARAKPISDEVREQLVNLFWQPSRKRRA